MVGTGRFELPTPRTPSECSTRLSHVPTRLSRPRRAGFEVLIQFTPEAGVGSMADEVRSHLSNREGHGIASGLVRGGNVFAREGRAGAEEELLHLLDQELLRLRGPRLQ